MGLNVKCGVGRERGLKAVLLHDREEGEDEGAAGLSVGWTKKGEKTIQSIDGFFVFSCR